MMVKAKDEERAIARELRQQGWSYGEIAKELNVSKSSVRGWCNDIEISREQEKAIQHRKHQWGTTNVGAKINQEKGLQQRLQYQLEGRTKARERHPLHVIGCMLYWAEGAKTKRNALAFANSDPEMLHTFIRFIREQLNIPDEKIKLQIFCYTQTDEERFRVEKFWLDFLALSKTALYRTQILKGSDKRHNRLEFGVCSIRVQGTEYIQHIYGAIQEYGGFVNEEWLY